MNFLARLSAAAVAAYLVTSCGTTHTTMIGPARPATTPEAVRVYTTPPRHYEQIAIINSSGDISWLFAARASLDTALNRLRTEAASVGANGVLLQEVYDQSPGGLSVGIGSFGFGGGRHSVYGGGGAVNMGGPLINKRIRAIAIYVR